MKKAASIMVLVLLAATLLSACSSSDNGIGGRGTKTISITGGEGTSATGYGGYGGYGGSGGFLGVYPYDNATAKIMASGKVDTTMNTEVFTKYIASANLDFGSEPLDVTADMTIKTYPTLTAAPGYGGAPDDTLVADGEYHMHGSYTYLANDSCDGYGGSTASLVNNTTLYKRVCISEVCSDVQVTGIHVHPGKTLTFQPNLVNNNSTACMPAGDYSFGSTLGLDQATISNSVTYGIWNEGTITVQDLVTGANEVGNTLRSANGTSADKASLDLETNSSTSGIFLNDGLITTRGSDTTPVVLTKPAKSSNKPLLGGGGQGGNLYAWGGAVFVNRGTVDTSGGNGTDGGNAGYADLEGGYGVWNSGPVTARGGIGLKGMGGIGNSIEFWSYNYQGLIYNSGTLDSSGGDGAYGGGDASGSGFYNGDGADSAGIVNTGMLIGNGGSATTAGDGGNGASSYTNGHSDHEFGAYVGDIRNSGSIEMKGGAGKGDSSYGGNGGNLWVWTAQSYDYWSDPAGNGSIHFTGSILADGGTGGAQGGSGGDVEFYNYNYNSVVMGGTIELIGYSNVILTGGKGYLDGGTGGGAELFWEFTNSSGISPSSIYNDANFDMSGGQGMTNSGGAGGYFFGEISHDWYNWWYKANKGVPAVPQGSFENHGNITTRGGQGALAGAAAGISNDGYWSNAVNNDYSIWMFASGDVINTGALNASGGDATHRGGAGGNGQLVAMDALGRVSNTGAITTSGGSGAASGGNAGWVYLYNEGGLLFNTGTIAAKGGNADGQTGTGGNGNDVYIYSYYFGSPTPMVQNSVVPAVAGGTGNIPGYDGWFYDNNSDPHGVL